MNLIFDTRIQTLLTICRRITLFAIGWLLATIYNSRNNQENTGMFAPLLPVKNESFIRMQPSIQLVAHTEEKMYQRISKSLEERAGNSPFLLVSQHLNDITFSEDNYTKKTELKINRLALADTHEVGYKNIVDMVERYIRRVRREAKTFNLFKGKQKRANLEYERLFVYIDRDIVEHMFVQADATIREHDTSNRCGGLIGLFGVDSTSIETTIVPKNQTIILMPYDERTKRVVAIRPRDNPGTSEAAYIGYQRWKPGGRLESIPIQNIIKLDSLEKEPELIEGDTIFNGIEKQLRLLGIPKPD